MKKYILISTLVFGISVLLQAQDTQTMKEILSDYPYETHYISIDDTEIAYIKEGHSKQTLLLVHGLSSNLEAWSQNIKALSADYTVIALDLPGYGKSEKPLDAAYTPTYFASMIDKFLIHMNLPSAIFVGHSMGGQALIKFASLYPKKVEKLVLIAPAGIETFTAAQGNAIKAFMTPEIVKNTTEDQIHKNYALNFYQVPECASTMIQDRINIRKAIDFEAHTKAIVGSVYGMLDDKVTEDLPKIHVPILIIFGENDNLIPNKYLNTTLSTENIGQLAKENLVDSSLIFIDKAGHFVQYEQPKLVNEAILKFLKR